MSDAGGATNRLGELRKAKGLEPYDLAAIVRRSVDSVRRWERGGQIPSEFIPLLAAELETTSDHLMGWDREPVESGKAA